MATAINDSGGGGPGGNEEYPSRSHSSTVNGRIKDTYNTEGKLGSADGGSIYGKLPSQDIASRQIVEIPFWIQRDRPPKWISGINRSTTCRDVLLSIVRASHTNSKINPSSQALLYTEADVLHGKLVLVEEWKGVVKPLSATSRILKIWNAWGDERTHVRFIVKRASTSSARTSNNLVTNNVPNQRNCVTRNSSVTRRLDTVPTVSTGTARTRRKVRRRNSTSSVGSRQSIDEMHPKAIHELHQKHNSHGGSRSPNRHRKLVRNSKNDDNIRMDGESDYSRLSHNENFDQQIEEMMRAIVEQGKLIHDQLQRFNDKTTASSKSNSSNFQPKVNVQAQVHSPLATKNESGSTPSSLNDSTSTSTSINVLSRDEPLPKSYSHNNKSKPMLASADFIPSPNTIHSLTDNNMSNRRDFTPNRDSNLKYPSKSYDNYETIFPTSPVSPNSTFQGNTSVDQLPVSRLQSENGVYKHIANIHSNISTALPKDDVQKTASSSSVAWLTSSQSSMPRAGSNLKGPNTSNNLDSEPIRNISIEQTTNHDFQIVDITNVSKVGKEHEDKRKSSLLTENSIHDTSFSSSSTSESANKNTQLSVRGSAISDRLNQSVDLMNLSVLENSNNSGDPLSVYGYLPTNHHNQGNLKDYSGTENSIELNSEADIRFKRDKLILKTIHSELTKLVQMNDRLAFAEDSVDRLKIAIRQVQDQDMLDTERQCNSAPNLSMSAEEAEEHIACAKEQLERLKVANDDASKAIEKNKGSIEDIDKKVKAGKATVKNLEYDVNVIEKESRKLNKELEKVLKLEIGEEGDDHSSETILDDEKKYSSGGVKSEDIAVLSESLDISVCTEDVTLMSKLNGSPDNSNTEDSVDSTAMFPELLQLGSANGNSARQISNTYLLKQEDLNPNPSIRVDPDRQTQLLSITTDINAVHRVGCFEDIRSAINGSPAGSGASSSGNSTGNSSDKSVRFNDTEIIHPHHEYTTSSSSMTPDLPDLPDEPASRGSYTMAIKTGCNSSILSLLAKSAKNSSTSKPNLKSQRSGEEKIANGAGSNVDVDTDNSDTGLSSLHSSSDEATFEPGTLV